MTRCPACQAETMVGVEYGYHYSATATAYGHPDHYDGVSEYQCQYCKRRYGRWSGKQLAQGETEKVRSREKPLKTIEGGL